MSTETSAGSATEASETTSVVTPSRRPVALRLLEKYALVILTILVFAFFSFYPASSSVFPTVANLNLILGSQAVIALVAIAAIFPLIAGSFDFSLGATAALSQVLAAGLMSRSGWPLWAAIVAAICAATLVGVANGFLVTRVRMSPFVTTLGMAMLLAGITLWYTGGQAIVVGIDPALTRFGSSRWFGLPVVVYLVLAVALVVWYFLTHTPPGRALYAIGSNASSARLVGIRVDRDVWWSFMVAAAIAGLAGVLMLSRLGSATASAGNEILFPALAALFLGATTILPGFFNVFGTLIGAVFVSVSVSGLTLSGASGWASNVFNGAALLAAVALSSYLGRRRGRA